MIEEKLARLTPDQQREVEDFIDFLMNRDFHPVPGDHYPVRSTGFSEITDDFSGDMPTAERMDRPVSRVEPADILAGYAEYGAAAERQPLREFPIKGARKGKGRDPGDLLDWFD